MTTLEQLTFVPPAEPALPDPRVVRMAAAGFATYFARRPYAWYDAGNAVQLRWETMARRILAGTITTPEELWRDYTADMYGVPAFSGVHRLRWQSVLSAMKIAETAEVAA
jgi:hypothetical protein